MPIYAYRCSACGHEQDVLQKMSDATLSVCPACGQASYAKQVTAAGFQLKGSGWYVTDFRNNGARAATASKDSGEAAKPAAAPAEASETAAAPAAVAPAAPATPALPAAST